MVRRGSADEYIELYNTTDAPLNISGWSVLYDSAANPITIASGVTLPARGYYLLTGSGYSLSVATNQASGVDIPEAAGLQLRNAGGVTQDAVAFAGSTVTGEGTALSSAPNTAGEYAFVRIISQGKPQDTGDNAADFNFISTDAGLYNGNQSQLGAPGPQNLSSPINRNEGFSVALLQPGITNAANRAPNRARATSATAKANPNSPLGTLALRRTITNTSGQVIKRLRFRVINQTSLQSPGYNDTNQADLRLISSTQQNVILVGGGSVPVSGTTLEEPAQSLGGALNSSVVENTSTADRNAGTLVLGTPLGINESRSYTFLFGVQRDGNYTVTLNIEADTN